MAKKRKEQPTNPYTTPANYSSPWGTQMYANWGGYDTPGQQAINAWMQTQYFGRPDFSGNAQFPPMYANYTRQTPVPEGGVTQTPASPFFQGMGFPYAPQPAPGIAPQQGILSPEGRATTTPAPAFSPFGGVGPFTGEEWANMTRNYSPGGYWTGQGIDYGLSYENLSRGKDTGEPGALNAYGQPIGTPAPFKIRGKGGPQGGARRHIGKPPPTVIIKGKPTEYPIKPKPTVDTGVPTWMGMLSNWTI